MSLGNWPATPLTQAPCFEGCDQDNRWSFEGLKAKVYISDTDVCISFTSACVCVAHQGLDGLSYSSDTTEAGRSRFESFFQLSCGVGKGRVMQCRTPTADVSRKPH